MIKKTKRHILLLEVLIAMVLVALCAFPLLAPHFMMINQEKILVDDIEADRIAGVVFVNIVEKMYQGNISWDSINSRDARPVEGKLILEAGIPKNWPYEITYRFGEPKLKPNKTNPKFGLYPVWIEMKPKKGSPIPFFYEIFVEKEQTEGIDEEEDES